MEKKIVNNNESTVNGRGEWENLERDNPSSVRLADNNNENKTGKKSSMKQRKLQRRIFYITVAALPFLHYLIFYIGVNFNSILLAFKQWKMADGDMTLVWGGFSNFSRNIPS